MPTEQTTFEEIFDQNERRIYYHIHKLNIRDPHKDFFQEGLVALWNAYETYEPDKGPMATYFNFTIRNRLIDLVRKETRKDQNEEKIVQEKKTQLDDGNHIRRTETAYPVLNYPDMPLENPYNWDEIKAELTDNQWKWVCLYIINNMSVKEIANKENTTEDAVKSWGRQVRKKLRNEEFRKKIQLV